MSKFYIDRFSSLITILIFVTVAREGSVSRAAEVLNLTQPAISHQFKRLAEEKGLTLFNRNSNRVADHS
ncbi:LysR family transcriptional regulator [Ruegeria atlantica]|uniref:LysR family transcriptional regulator n=1 Tax=Ruegeria atlantica TaxID=81569 RepID=UPI00147D74EB|nr:LysR family transcriptional regulator [Ruegeria atlantica]